MEPTRVLLVDDDKTVTRLLVMLLTEDPEIEVVGTALNGLEALAKVPELHPDVIILDVEMPVMDGLETVSVLHKRHPHVIVIMFSTYTQRGASQTLKALARGASDYITKPTTGLDEARNVINLELRPKITALMDHKVGLTKKYSVQNIEKPKVPVVAPAPVTAVPYRPTTTPTVLVIGASTGGPQALSTLFATLPPTFPAPILVVQHMAATFTRLFAQRLAQSCAIPVSEGADGDLVRPGCVVIAPGDYHMELGKNGEQITVSLNQAPQQNFCRPSLDPLFVSAARQYGRRVLAVVLTGMGHDGLRGCQAVRDAGGQVLVQDEASSAVWGMPKHVAKAGLADKVLTLDDLAPSIMNIMAPTGTAGWSRVSDDAAS